MGDCNYCKECKSRDKTDGSSGMNNNLSICFFTILAPGNIFDNTRPGLVLVNGKELTLSPIQKKCKPKASYKCKCEEQESAILTGCLFWTVSVPIRSDCAPMGSNVGFQSVSGTQIINQEVRGNLSNFNNCAVSARLVEITPKDPCAPDFQSDGQPVIGTFIFMPNVSS